MNLVMFGEAHIEAHTWLEKNVFTVAVVTVRRLHVTSRLVCFHLRDASKLRLFEDETRKENVRGSSFSGSDASEDGTRKHL